MILSARTQSCLLHCLRNAESACGSVAVNGGPTNSSAANGNAVLAPGLRGAAARVVPWALARAVGLLSYAGRRPARFAPAGANAGEPTAMPAATPDERVILNIVGALARGDRAGAERAAEWLVRPVHRDALLRALTPAAEAI